MTQKINWQVGCAGFHYKEWKTVFYPEKLQQRLWFEYYCKHFNTLEVNNSFYQFPRLSTLESWYNQSPDGFSFSFKAPRIITHYKKFIDTERLLEDFYGALQAGLHNKIGAVLFQLPPQLRYSDELLHRIIGSMHAGYQNVIEFRHPSWWTKEVYRQLAAHQICFCGISYPGGKIPDTVIANIDTVYYRFHGVPVLYKSQYENETLQNVVEEISSNKQVKKAFIYFNNTWGTAALNNAIWLKQYI